MKLAIIGSRDLHVEDLAQYVTQDVTEIVSGGAKGIDCDAEVYAKANNIKFTVFKPDYERYKRGAPIVRNKQIVDYADEVLAFWNGDSRGTLNVIEYCRKQGKKISIIRK